MLPEAGSNLAVTCSCREVEHSGLSRLGIDETNYKIGANLVAMTGPQRRFGPYVLRPGNNWHSGEVGEGGDGADRGGPCFLRLMLDAAGGVDTNSKTGNRPGVLSEPKTLGHCMPSGLADGPTDPFELGEDYGTCNSIFCQPTAFLKLDDAPLSIRSENAVFLAGVEPEEVQSVLEGFDIIASHHGAAIVENPVAHDPTRFDELPPGIGPNYAVGRHSAAFLKGTDRRSRCVVVGAGGTYVITEPSQA